MVELESLRAFVGREVFGVVMVFDFTVPCRFRSHNLCTDVTQHVSHRVCDSNYGRTTCCVCVWIAPVLVRETFTELFLSRVSCWESSYCASKRTIFKSGRLLQSASVLDGTISE